MCVLTPSRIRSRQQTSPTYNYRSSTLLPAQLHVSMTLYHPDYVCVLDIDLLELAITTWKGSDKGKLVSAPCLHTCVSFTFTQQPPSTGAENCLSLPGKNVNLDKHYNLVQFKKTTNKHRSRVYKYLLYQNEVSL